MATHPRLLIAALVLGATTVASGQTAPSASQARLAADVLSDDYAVSGPAVGRAQGLKPAQVGPELRAALFAALAREARSHQERYEAASRYQLLKPLEHPEHISFLTRTVVALRDPASIPALAATLFTGSLVPHAISQFGEAAAPAVIGVVTNDQGWHEEVSGGLMALRFMVERRGSLPLSASTLQQVRDATLRILNGGPRFPVLWQAIDLAIVLDDPELKAVVETLAKDPNAVMARGIVASHIVESTQQRARDRLAGIPPLPRPGKSEDRRR